MKIVRYHALLNSGCLITETSPEGGELIWPSLHWSAAPNRIQRNQVFTEERNECITVSADIAMEVLPFTETMCFAERNPIIIELDEKAESDIIAYYYFKDWWTRPAFISSFEKVPDETVILFYWSNGAYHFLLALPGKVFRAHFEGMTGCKNIRLVLSADGSGYTCCSETAMLAVSDSDPYRCMEKGMQLGAGLYGIPIRGKRAYPDLFNKIGWCSWDAFYKDVSEEGLIAKAKEVRDQKLPFGWMIIDDGWQDYRDEQMLSYGADPEKFPHGLKGAVERIQEICGIDRIGVWHAFSGYWKGIHKDGKLVKEHPERFFLTHQGKLMIKPDFENAYAFYSDWYDFLKSQKISFVKVDSQSSTRQHYRTNTPTGETSAVFHKALDKAAADYMNDGLINCMGMAMEDVLQRPCSALSRNSDDFFPMAEESFKEHLLENAYNTVWHNVIYYGDWDMFWSAHTYARKHALLRALSAGPVYVSDRVGETDRDVLMPLCYEDGTLLRADQAAVPTADCLLKDPDISGYLKLGNIYHGLGYMAVYSYKAEKQTVNIKISDLTALASVYDTELNSFCTKSRFAVFDYFAGKGFTTENTGEWDCRLEESGCSFYQVAPILNGIAFFGRSDKYLSSHAICSAKKTEDGCLFEIRETGPVLIYAEQMPVCSVNGIPAGTVSLKSKGFYRIEMSVNEEPARILISF